MNVLIYVYAEHSKLEDTGHEISSFGMLLVFKYTFRCSLYLGSAVIFTKTLYVPVQHNV